MTGIASRLKMWREWIDRIAPGDTPCIVPAYTVSGREFARLLADAERMAGALREYGRALGEPASSMKAARCARAHATVHALARELAEEEQ